MWTVSPAPPPHPHFHEEPASHDYPSSSVLSSMKRS
jgi:hypothetical protein